MTFENKSLDRNEWLYTSFTGESSNFEVTCQPFDQSHGGFLNEMNTQCNY